MWYTDKSNNSDKGEQEGEPVREFEKKKDTQYHSPK